jgi:anthranilate/para-aminobenzoate synthase component I
VRGRLRPEVALPELLRATFPGGSVTGAPKLRAMEIIDEIEVAGGGVVADSDPAAELAETDVKAEAFRRLCSGPIAPAPGR